MGFCGPFFVVSLIAIIRLNLSNITKRPVSMARVFHGNFDFEHELASAGYNRPRQIERLHAEMTAHLLALAEHGDQLFYSCPAPNEFLAEAASAGFSAVHTVGHGDPLPSHAELAPWGWSNQAVGFAMDHGLNCDGPEIDCVARLNSRRSGN